VGCEHGGILGLLSFLSEFEEPLEADLLRFWHLDLPADLGTMRLTWRRLGILVRNLPAESATLRAMHGHAADWSVTDHLLAAVVDVLQGGNWQRGGGKGKRPKPLERPKSAQVMRERRRRMEEMAAKHAAWKQRRRSGG
jgi:hypothetical protein